MKCKVRLKSYHVLWKLFSSLSCTSSMWWSDWTALLSFISVTPVSKVPSIFATRSSFAAFPSANEVKSKNGTRLDYTNSTGRCHTKAEIACRFHMKRDLSIWKENISNSISQHWYETKTKRWNHGWTHFQELPILSARPEELNVLRHGPWVGNTHDITVIKILRYNGKRYYISKLNSHCFGFFPCFSPYVNSMTSDQHSTRVWVFFHCTCHSFLEILLFWCILNNGNH